MQDYKSGWSWFGTAESNEKPENFELALCFARVFRGADAERVLKHLRAVSVEQVVGPAASEALLRHIEGQRQLVTHIQALIERGRENSNIQSNGEQ